MEKNQQVFDALLEEMKAEEQKQGEDEQPSSSNGGSSSREGSQAAAASGSAAGQGGVAGTATDEQGAHAAAHGVQQQLPQGGQRQDSSSMSPK